MALTCTSIFRGNRSKFDRHILPLHKSGCHNDVNIYGPISLLISLSKVFERVIHHRLYRYSEKFNLVEKFSCFSPKHFTIDCVAKLTENIRTRPDASVNCSVGLDLRKLFETVDHFLPHEWKLLVKISLGILENSF